MLAGQVITAPAAPAWSAIEETDQNPVTSTSATNGSPVCGLFFTAPTSGMVLLQVAANMEIISGTGILRCGWRLRTGSTAGSGTLIDGTESADGTHGGGAFRLETKALWAAGSALAHVSGLTAGAVYNIASYHYISSGSGLIYSRAVMVFPLL